MFLDAEQRHEGKNAALAVIVDAHRKDHVFYGRDNDQRPQDQREDAKDDVGPRRAAGQAENGLERIKGARPDVTKDDFERRQTHCSQTRSIEEGGGIRLWGFRRGFAHRFISCYFSNAFHTSL